MGITQSVVHIENNHSRVGGSSCASDPSCTGENRLGQGWRPSEGYHVFNLCYRFTPAPKHHSPRPFHLQSFTQPTVGPMLSNKDNE